jgi:hypothetical protein
MVVLKQFKKNRGAKKVVKRRIYGEKLKTLMASCMKQNPRLALPSAREHNL